jgi:hypothetical protein
MRQQSHAQRKPTQHRGGARVSFLLIWRPYSRLLMSLCSGALRKRVGCSVVPRAIHALHSPVGTPRRFMSAWHAEGLLPAALRKRRGRSAKTRSLDCQLLLAPAERSAALRRHAFSERRQKAPSACHSLLTQTPEADIKRRSRRNFCNALIMILTLERHLKYLGLINRINSLALTFIFSILARFS